MKKIKTRFRAGLYELNRVTFNATGPVPFSNNSFRVNLTAGEARTLMTKDLYCRLGFNGIYLVED